MYRIVCGRVSTLFACNQANRINPGKQARPLRSADRGAAPLAPPEEAAGATVAVVSWNSGVGVPIIGDVRSSAFSSRLNGQNWYAGSDSNLLAPPPLPDHTVSLTLLAWLSIVRDVSPTPTTNGDAAGYTALCPLSPDAATNTTPGMLKCESSRVAVLYSPPLQLMETMVAPKATAVSTALDISVKLLLWASTRMILAAGAGCPDGAAFGGYPFASKADRGPFVHVTDEWGGTYNQREENRPSAALVPFAPPR